MKIIVGILIILVIALSGCSATQTPTMTASTAPQPTAVKTSTTQLAQTTVAPTKTATTTKADNSIKAGMYKVGKDIQPGEYVIFATGSIPSYFAITKDSSGALGSIITNDLFSGNRYVSITDGQYLEFKSAKMLKLADSPILTPVAGKYPEGMYKVGRDITAGEYKVVAEADMAYYAVEKDLSGSIESIVANDNFNGTKYVTITEGQYIKLSGCYIPK